MRKKSIKKILENMYDETAAVLKQHEEDTDDPDENFEAGFLYGKCDAVQMLHFKFFGCMITRNDDTSTGG